MAKAIGLSEKHFSEKYCQLLLQLFPAPTSIQKGLVISPEELPSKVLKKLEKKAGKANCSFIALPSIALKRRGKSCVLLGKENDCKVHDSKPGQCSLFPFISTAEKPDFLALYGFCSGLKAEKNPPKDWQKKVFLHQKNFSDHFKEINEKGFSAIWGYWPKKGIVLLKDRKICPIGEKEFFNAIKKFS